MGEPLTTDTGTLVVAFFAQFSDSKMVVDVDVLVDAVNENRDDISAAVSSSAHCFCGNTHVVCHACMHELTVMCMCMYLLLMRTNKLETTVP